MSRPLQLPGQRLKRSPTRSDEAGDGSATVVEAQIQFPIESTKRLCVRCRKRQVYLDIRTMDYCEPCIWDAVKTAMESLGATRFDNLHPVRH